MRVISMKRLRAFWEVYPDAERPLRDWYKAAEKAEWRSIVDVRRDYPHADAVVAASGTTMTVFNIGGNKYRLVARVIYPFGRVFAKLVLTHAEYDRDRWKETL